MANEWAARLAARAGHEPDTEPEPKADKEATPAGEAALQQRVEEVVTSLRGLEARRSAARPPAPRWAARAAARMHGDDGPPDGAA
ncbi:MAG: hypothetical protein JWO67_1950 [Streptosporangiaceae bacterium]|nr:hypothetical protein [Streptosporangiaceae bacterium]